MPTTTPCPTKSPQNRKPKKKKKKQKTKKQNKNKTKYPLKTQQTHRNPTNQSKHPSQPRWLSKNRITKPRNRPPCQHHQTYQTLVSMLISTPVFTSVSTPISTVLTSSHHADLSRATSFATTPIQRNWLECDYWNREWGQKNQKKPNADL